MKNSIKTKSDFWCLRNCSLKCRTSMLTAILVKHHGDYPPLSCVVASKKSVGNAVMRNRAKRRIRTLIQKHSKFLERGDMLMVITCKRVCSASWSQLESEYCRVMSEVTEKWKS